MAAVSGSHERSSILVNEFDTEELLDSSRRQENKVFFVPPRLRVSESDALT